MQNKYAQNQELLQFKKALVKIMFLLFLVGFAVTEIMQAKTLPRSGVLNRSRKPLDFQRVFVSRHIPLRFRTSQSNCLSF
jgi:hypothetical protein